MEKVERVPVTDGTDGWSRYSVTIREPMFTKGAVDMVPVMVEAEVLVKARWDTIDGLGLQATAEFVGEELRRRDIAGMVLRRAVELVMKGA